ncbi:glycosyltransferase family 2 protein [Cellulomonas sp. 73-92]|uniref:glycosyltransferase family 2 protein n=1 Tax=Cellulomonas sp. 73-92 TaxID=1895740 RepID=UPI000ACDAE47|nr:glycosyltransferase family 2 protein [Cellulomonas sp. 73-92]
MTPPATIEILMAAYQGGAYIDAQIESVLAQTCHDWVLRIRDDNSADDTYAVAQRRAADHPHRIVVNQRPSNSGSASQNFLEMLVGSTGRYVMLADDDDVWREDKVALTLAEMQRIEASVGAGVPVLVHTDAAVVDQSLRITSPSMAHVQKLPVHETRLARLLVQNSVTGCTVMINRALADLVREPFDGVAMHDWWLALIAAAFGRIGYVEAPTLLYRQHGGNAVGAVDARDARYLLGRALDGNETRARMRAASAQASAFLAQFGDRLSARDLSAVATCAGLENRGKLARVTDIARSGLWKNTALRRIGQILHV